MYKIINNIFLEICKKHVLTKKSPRKHQIPKDRRALMRKRSKLQKKIQRSIKYKKNVLNQIKEIKKLKNINKYRKKSKRNESYCCYKKEKYFYKFVKKNN